MASAVGAVYGVLGLDSTQFVKGLQNAQASARTGVAQINSAFAGINKGAMQIKSALGAVTGAFTGMNLLIAGLAGGGLLAITKRSMDYADSLHDISIQIGLTTKGLQEFYYAAQLAGQTTEDFNASMGIFYKNVGQLRLGMGALSTFLKSYDTTVLENIRNAKSQEEALRIVADAVKNAKTTTDQAAIATAAFGRSGLSMIQMLQDGAAGLNNMAERANALGLVISEDLINKAGEANDKLDTLRMVVGTQLTNAVVQLAPLIGDLAQRFSDGLPVLIQYVDKFAQFFGIIGKDNAGRLADVTTEIASLNKLLSKNETLQKTLSLGGLLGDFDHDNMSKRLEELRKERDAIIAQMQAAQRAPAAGGGGPAAVYKPTPSSANAQAVNNRVTQAKEVVKVTQQQNTEIARQIDLNDELGDSIRENDEKAKRWASNMQQVGDRVASSFESAVLSGAKLSDTLKALALDIARMIYQQTAGQAISSGVGAMISGAFAAFGGGGAAAPVASGGGTMIAHTGGVVGQTQLPKRYHTGGMVGFPPLQQGEVPIIAQKGEMILTKEQQAAIGSGSGGPIIINIDARGADAGVDAKIRAAVPIAVQAAMKQYDDAKRRNPNGLR